MNEIEKNKQLLIELCKKLAVNKLEVFGSALREDFDPAASDIDFFYELSGDHNLLHRYLELKSGLERLLGRNVDLIAEKYIANPYLKSNIAYSPKKLIYAT